MKTKKTVKARFWQCVFLGIPLAIILGILTGLMREHLYNTILYTWGAAILIALLVREIGQEIKFSFALLAVSLILITLFFSDLVTVGALNQLSFWERFTYLPNYVWALEYPFVRVNNVLAEMVYRAIAIYGTFHYSRII